MYFKHFVPTSQVKSLGIGQQLGFRDWSTHKSLDKAQVSGFLQGEQIQIAWNRTDAP